MLNQVIDFVLPANAWLADKLVREPKFAESSVLIYKDPVGDPETALICLASIHMSIDYFPVHVLFDLLPFTVRLIASLCLRRYLPGGKSSKVLSICGRSQQQEPTTLSLLASPSGIAC